MRTLRIILSLMAILGVVTAVGWAQNASKAAIVGSAHDFTHDTWNQPAASKGTGVDAAVVTNLCYFCHIMHKTVTSSSGLIGGTAGAVGAPGYLLWNHQLSSTASYGVYTSDTFTQLLGQTGSTAPTDLGINNGAGTSFGLLTVSNLCLSCHDGTVAIGSFYEGGLGLPANGSMWNNGHGDSTNMYTGMEINSLAQSHPVHFPYTAQLASLGTLRSPAGTNSVDGSGYVPLYGNASMLECSTCHDPHNGTFVTGMEPGTTATTATTIYPFPRLYLSTINGTTTGGFCVYCHI